MHEGNIWTSFAVLPHLNQAAFVVGEMQTLLSLLVHEGDASFLVGHLLSASVSSPRWPMWLAMTHTYLEGDALG